VTRWVPKGLGQIRMFFAVKANSLQNTDLGARGGEEEVRNRGDLEGAGEQVIM
jgi:hypothetical protein